MFQPIGLAAAQAVEKMAQRVAFEFGPVAQIRAFKANVRKVVRLGAGHPANMARYGKRLAIVRERIDRWRAANSLAAKAFNFDPASRPDIALAIAIRIIEEQYREERHAFAVAAALGRGNRLALTVLRELRLILRVLRRSNYRGHFSGLLAFSVGAALEAAE